MIVEGFSYGGCLAESSNHIRKNQMRDEFPNESKRKF